MPHAIRGNHPNLLLTLCRTFLTFVVRVKILVLTHLYPPHHAGTYDLRCQIQTDALRLRGHTIKVLTSKHGMINEQRGPEIDRRLILSGVFEHPATSGYRDLRNLEIQNHQILRETITEFQPD